MNNKILKSLVLCFASLIILGLLTAIYSPDATNLGLIVIAILLIYILSSSAIYIILSLSIDRSKVKPFQVSALLGCLPPAIIVLTSLRQASWFDILLIATTVIAIFWYSVYKN